MKRHLLAVMIPVLLASGTVNAVQIYNKEGNKLDLYGKIDARHQFSSYDGEDGDQSYIQFGLKGESCSHDPCFISMGNGNTKSRPEMLSLKTANGIKHVWLLLVSRLHMDPLTTAVIMAFYTTLLHIQTSYRSLVATSRSQIIT